MVRGARTRGKKTKIIGRQENEYFNEKNYLTSGMRKTNKYRSDDGEGKDVGTMDCFDVRGKYKDFQW